MERRTVHQTWFLILLGTVTAAFIWLTLDFIEPVFWAAVAAIIFDPLETRMEEFFGGRKTPAALVSLLIIILVVFIPLGLVALAMSNEALNMYARFQEGDVDVKGMIAGIDPMLRELTRRIGIDPGSIEQRISDAAGSAAQMIAASAVVVGQNVLSLVAKTGLMLYLLFFFLRDGDRLLTVLADAIPMGASRQRLLFERFTTVTRATLKGTLFVAAVQGTLGGILFWLLDIRAPVFWGVIMTMLSLVPLVGAAFVWAPAAVILMLTGSVAEGIILVAGGVLVVGTADNILRPVLVGRETSMPDYLVLLSTLGGLSVLGPAGFVAGPVLAALFISVWDMFSREQKMLYSSDEAPPVIHP